MLASHSKAVHQETGMSHAPVGVGTATRHAHETYALLEFFDASGTDVLLSKSPADFAAHMRAETKQWLRVVQLVGVKAP
jgi:hypothetical protein